MSNQSWSIIIICYNESGSIKRVTEKACRVMKKMLITDWEVLIVDDGSADGSREIIESLKIDNVRYIFHEKNKGIGHTLRTGYSSAINENICVVPGDGEFNLDELIPFALIKENQFVSFYRIENTSYSVFRNYLSKLNKWVNKLLNGFQLLDVNWVKIYKRADILNINLEIKSSLVESEICAKLLLLGKEVVEIESGYIPRTSGVSKGASFKIMFQALRDVIRLSFVLRSFRSKTK